MQKSAAAARELKHVPQKSSSSSSHSLPLLGAPYLAIGQRRRQLLLAHKLGRKARLHVARLQGRRHVPHILVLQRAAEAQAQQAGVPEVQQVAARERRQGVWSSGRRRRLSRDVRACGSCAERQLRQSRQPWRCVPLAAYVQASATSLGCSANKGRGCTQWRCASASGERRRQGGGSGSTA